LRAGLLLLDADPLEDNRNIQHRVGVMVRGRWYTADKIERKFEMYHEKSHKLSNPTPYEVNR
jgi:hypothetical protein